MARRVSRHQFWTAMTITLALHATVLIVLAFQPVQHGRPASTEFVAVDFVNASDFEPAKEQSMEQMIQSRLNERVANLTANEQSERVQDRLSTASAPDIQSLTESVEAELRAMEQAEFERLAADKKDFGLEGVPDDGASDAVETLTEWDKRYDGQVTVSYDLGGRIHRNLPIPGYKCRVAGSVAIAIKVAPDGRVIQSKIESVELGSVANQGGVQSDASGCIARAALESAAASIFIAVANQPSSGVINYRFLAQD